MNPYGNNGFNKINQGQRQQTQQGYPNQGQQPMYPNQQPMFPGQQPVTPQQQAMMQQQMAMQQQAMMQQQMARSTSINPAMNQPFGQPTTNQQQPTQSVGRAFSSLVENTTQPVSPVSNTQEQPQVQEQPQQPVERNISNYVALDGHEFPPYYNPETEKLVKVADDATRTFYYKIVDKEQK